MSAQSDWNKRNKNVCRGATRRWREKFPEKVLAQNKDRARLKKNWQLKKYGLTLDEWEAVLKSQGGVCAICKSSDPASLGWNTDHSHMTGRFRGILCSSCNWLLGNAKDNIEVLKEAIKYLERANNATISS